MEDWGPPASHLREGRAVGERATRGGPGQVRPVSVVSEVSDFLSLSTLLACGLFERERRGHLGKGYRLRCKITDFTDYADLSG